MSTATSKNGMRQIVVYVDEDLYQQFEDLKAQDRRLSFSYLGERAIRRGWESVVKELTPSLSFRNPTVSAPGKRRSR